MLSVEGEGGARHVWQAAGLPAIAGRGDVGAPGSSRLLPIPPAPPDVTTRHRKRSMLNAKPAQGPGGSGRAAGWTLGGRLRTIRASLSRTQPGQDPKWANHVARQPPGALAEPEAGASAGRSKRRRVRAVSARLETVQKVITDRMPGRADAGRAGVQRRWMIHLKGCSGDTEPADEVGEGVSAAFVGSG